MSTQTTVLPNIDLQSPTTEVDTQQQTPLDISLSGSTTNTPVAATPTTKWATINADWYLPYVDENSYDNVGYTSEDEVPQQFKNQNYEIYKTPDGKFHVKDKQSGKEVQRNIYYDRTKDTQNVADIENSDKFKRFTDYVTKDFNNPELQGYYAGLAAANTVSKVGDTFTGRPGIFQIDENGNYIKDGDNYKVIDANYFAGMDENDARRNLYQIKKKNEDGTWGEYENTEDPAALYNYLRNDGKYGFYHWTPEEEEEEKIDPPENPPSIRRRNPPEMSQREYKPQPWTDWIHLSTVAANDLSNNARQYDLETQKKAALKEPVYKQAKVTNAYAERTLRAKKIAELRNQAKKMFGSDLDANMKYMSQVNAQANELEDQNILSKSKEFNETLQNVQNVANENTKESVSVANDNRQALAALHNERIAAKQKYLANRTALQDDFINKLDASHKKWLHDERTNKYNFDTGVAAQKYNKIMNTAYTDLSNAFDFKQSNTFNDWFNRLQKSNETLNGLDSNSYNNRQAVLEWIENHPNDPIVKNLLSAHDREKDLAELNFARTRNSAYGDYQSVALNQPYYVSGEGVWNSPRSRVSPLYQKKGGYAEAIRDHRKAHENLDKTVRENSRMLEKRLARTIGALDRETLVYLKALFK